MKVGALCAGYGGLELALALAGWEPELEWFSDIEPASSMVMTGRFGAPNLGDLTEISDPPTVDVVTAGFPCQPFSHAGKRAGVHDERWLIDDVCRVAAESGARWLVLENVAGLLTANDGDAMARVCSALAEFGFDAEWGTLRASDVGAPHQRLRWFCVAAADADSTRLGRSTQLDSAPPTRLDSQHRGHVDRLAVETHRAGDFGPYEPAVRRWEHILGRPAPAPTDDGRLNPRFVEFMMGLPDGWVCDVIPERSKALKLLGNGVVPQQAAAAISGLVAR